MMHVLLQECVLCVLLAEGQTLTTCKHLYSVCSVYCLMASGVLFSFENLGCSTRTTCVGYRA